MRASLKTLIKPLLFKQNQGIVTYILAFIPSALLYSHSCLRDSPKPLERKTFFDFAFTSKQRGKMFKKYYFVSSYFAAFKPAHSLRALGMLSSAFLFACSTTPSVPALPGDDVSHLSLEAPLVNEDIPSIVQPLPLLNEPQAQVAPELYSVVAQDVSVRELLFAMARDASINIDIHPAISGQVSINAIDQALPQILERVSNQVDLRWGYDANGNLLVEPDSPYWKIYSVDYVNVERSATTSVNVSNTIASVGDGGSNTNDNESNATITQSSTNNFWGSLTENLISLLGEVGTDESSPVIANTESGIINIRATSRQHEDVSSFINFVQTRALQEVMIEATIVEVNLNDNFQSGVDWSAMARNSGKLDINQSLLNGSLGTSPFTSLTLSEGSGTDDISATVKLLSEFGDLRVLSSPKIMALNNQPAMLRVVDNIVYFSLEVESGTQSLGTTTQPIVTTELHTVPVGFVMTVTPQVGQNEQITLNVRPTVSRILRFIPDPNPDLGAVQNLVPEIQVSEIESILKVFNGEIAVLGGLMQDSLSRETSGVPGVSRIPGIRNLFSNRADTSRKTELIIFIRPVIVQQPSLTGDLEKYQEFLPASTEEFFNQNTFIQPLN